MNRILIAAAMAVCVSLPASDWPQWRGVKRDGTLQDVRLPSELPQKLVRRWSVAVGLGHSSPVLAGGRLYVFTRNADQEVLHSLNPADGKIVWKQAYPAPYRVNAAATGHGPGPKSTPVVADGKIVTLGISGILSCHDVKDGRVLWRKEFGKEYSATSPLYGTGSSPVVERGFVIANVGGDGSGALAAFDLNTGAQKWAWKGDGPGYASPVLVDMAGVRQVVTQTEKNIIALRADTGELLWKMPFQTPYVQNIVTPVVYGDTLILAGLNNPTMSVRVTRNGPAFKAEQVWQSAEAPMYMSTPVLANGLLFGFSNRNKGQLFCQDPKTGKILWTGPPRQGENAALATNGSLVFALKDDGELIVAKAAAGALEVVRRYQVADSATWAHPLISTEGIYIKDVGGVSLWGFS
jgi:outer membrane protein assembly factor BamB